MRKVLSIAICTMSTLTHSHVQAADLKTYLTDAAGGTSASFYFPFETSFLSRLQSGATRERAMAWEKHGILDNGCPQPTPIFPVIYESAEYLPMLPNHATQVARSTALVFGETTGDLASIPAVDRYIDLDFDSTMLTSLGMHNKEFWTLHMVASPDSDDDNSRSYETIFEVGDTTLANPIRVTLDIDRQASQTLIRLQTEAQGNNVRTTSVTVSDADTAAVSGRRWYQIIAQFYKDTPTSPTRIRLYVHTINQSDVAIRNSSSTQSNDWRTDSGSVARIGNALDEVNPFHGSAHHFATWDRLLDSKPTNLTGIDDLRDAFATSYADPDTREKLTIDWNADPVYFTWDQPIDESILTIGTRNMRNWQDPIWDQDGAYPLVRLRVESPDNTGINYNPPTITKGAITYDWTEPIGQTPEDVALQTANWLEYLEVGLAKYTSVKSLADANACSLLWQNWGSEPWYSSTHAPDPCYYEDRGAAFSLMKNWRDVRGTWRDGSHYVLSTIDRNGGFSEINTPFYREGMSINAFRSVDTFTELAGIIATRAADTMNHPNPPVVPARFHFDTELYGNIQQAWKVSGGMRTAGWWDATIAVAESRNADLAHAIPASVPTDYNSDTMVDNDTLAGIESAVIYNDAIDRYNTVNRDLSVAFNRFSRDQYDHAFAVGLLNPALQELNSDIRMSEYDMVFAGPVADNEEYIGASTKGAITDVQPRWFDFSSPVTYPLKSPKFTGFPTVGPPNEDTLFEEWGTYLDINDLLVTDDLLNNGAFGAETATPAQVQADSAVVHVERAKHILNASYLAGGGHGGAPIAPWIAYPQADLFEIKNKFDIDGDGDPWDEGDVVKISVGKEDTARIAVFAHRRGVREFIFWGNLDLAGADVTAITADLHWVMRRIEDANNNSTDTTTTNKIPGDPLFGVPEGVVDGYDKVYFDAKYYAGDLEADFSGPNGRPDGIVDGTDLIDFNAAWLSEL